MHLVYNEQTGDFEEKLYVAPPKLSLQITNGDSTIFKGEKVHLVWTVEDAEKVTLDGVDIAEQIFSQDIQCDYTGIRDFVLIASNTCGETKRILSVSVIDKPSFDIYCSKPKLKKGKNETCEIRWNIRFAHSVSIITKEGKENVPSSGSKFLSPTETKIIKFEALAINNSSIFTESVEIGVYDESEVQFEADKAYSYPQLPVLLSWSVTNALYVELDGFGEQPANGTLIVEPTKTTVYRLLIKDEFGIKTYEKTIQMLPLPFIESIMSPTPNFESNLSLTIKQPKYNVEVRFPKIEIDWIKSEVPKIPSLTDLGLNVELSQPTLPKFNLMSSIKRVFNHLIKK